MGIAIWTAIRLLPLPWIVGISGGVFIIILVIIRLTVFSLRRKSARTKEVHRTAIEDIKSDLVNMSMYQREVATKKTRQPCPEKTAKQIYDDCFAFWGTDLAFIKNVVESVMVHQNIDPLIDFFKRYGDILDGNEYGLKVELEGIELYKSSRVDLAQKRLRLHKMKERKATIQKNIDRVCALIYGLNSSILLRGVLRSLPKTNGIVNPSVRIVLVVLEGLETQTEKSLTEMLDNLENEWKANIDVTQFDITQLQTLSSLLEALDAELKHPYSPTNS